ncbi:MAG TPA: hypothetical protein VMU26_27520 [Candidatus Polarisedimenticolia bacterium]|nr:hypothetical protein [Candidatus Polarisedimenticolia bacterium]
MSRSGQIGLDLIFALMLFSGAIATIRHGILLCLIVALTALEFTADLIVEFNPSLSHRGWDTAVKISGMAILSSYDVEAHVSSGPNSLASGHGWSCSVSTDRFDLGVRYKLLTGRRPDAIISSRSSAESRRVLSGDRNAHSLATAETLIGQLYPSILIATLAGMSLQARSDP